MVRRLIAENIDPRLIYSPRVDIFRNQPPYHTLYITYGRLQILIKARTDSDLCFVASFVYAVDKVRATFVLG